MSLLDTIAARIARNLAKNKLTDSFAENKTAVPAAMAGSNLARVGGSLATTNDTNEANTGKVVSTVNVGRQAMAVYQPETGSILQLSTASQGTSSTVPASSSSHPAVTLAAPSGLSFESQLNQSGLAISDDLAGYGLYMDEKVLHVGAGDGLSLSDDAISLASSVAGNGLTYAGGVLAVGAGTMITVAADSIGITAGSAAQYLGTGTGTTAAWQNLSDLAGAGLTISGAVMAVGAGYGITVNANDVQLATTVAGAGLTYTNGVLAVAVSNVKQAGAGGGLSVSADLVTLTASYDPGAASAVLASNSAGKLKLPDFEATTSVITPRLVSPAATELTIASAADTVLDPATNLVRLASGKLIRSNSFTSGFAGSGWQIDDGITYAGAMNAEFDNLTVRGMLKVYELVIQQIRATNGSIFVSSAAKLESATLVSGSSYRCVVDGETNDYQPFAVGDIIRAQRVNLGSGIVVWRSDLTVTAINVGGNVKTFDATLRAGTTAPAQGMEFVRLGNTSDLARQGAVYLTADDSGAPFIDVVNGITAHTDWNTAGKIKLRLGRLDGVTGHTNEYGMWAGDGTGDTAKQLIASTSEISLNNVPLNFKAGTSTIVMQLAAGSSAPYMALGSTLPTGPLVNNGIWMGKDGSDYEFRVGTVSAGALVKGMHWDGSNLVWKATNTSLDSSGNLSASNATLSGTVTATVGAIGNWTIASTGLTATNIGLYSGAANTARVQVGTGTDANTAGLNSANGTSDIALWAGSTHANRADAPFRVTAGGAFYATTGSVLGDLSVSGSGRLIAGGGDIIQDTSGMAIGLYTSTDPAEQPGTETRSISWYTTPNTRTGLQVRQYVGLDDSSYPHWNVTVDPGGASPATLTLWHGGAINYLWLTNINQVVGMPGLLLATGSPNTVQILSGARLQLNSGSAFVATTHLEAGTASTFDIGASGTPWRKIYVDEVVASTITGGTALSGQTWQYDSGDMYIKSSHTGTRTLYISNPGTGAINLDLEGSITLSGTVDGVDVAALSSAYNSHYSATAVHGATGAVVGTTNTQTLTNKTLTTPTIGDFTNAQHAHTGATSGGTIAHSSLTGKTANDHHNQSHVLATNTGLGADHTISGATAGHVLRASSATAASFAAIQDADLPSTIVRTSRTLTAGAGLTGGGDLSADRTFTVGAGTMITVNADDVAITAGANYQFIGTGSGTAPGWRNVSELAGAGLTTAIGILAVGAGAGITVNNDDVALTTPGTLTASTTNSSTGNHTHAITTGAAVTLTVASTNTTGSGSSIARADHTHAITSSSNPGAATSLLASDATGKLTLPLMVASTSVQTPLVIAGAGQSLTLQPPIDLILDPASNLTKMASGVSIQGSNFASQTTSWRITDSGEADFRYLFVDEMHAKSFIADLEQALSGGQIIAKSVAVLYSNFTAPAAGATAQLVMRDLPSATGMAVFVNGDYVRIRNFSRADGSLTISDCWGTVVLDTTYGVNGFDSATKTQRYTFTRSSGADAGAMAQGTVVYADAIVLDYGTAGNGFYEVNAIDGAYALNSPYAQVATWATHPRTVTVRSRFGNLRGIFSVADEFGIYAGSGTAVTDRYIRASSSAVELRNVPLALYDGTNNTLLLSAGAGNNSPFLAMGSPLPSGPLVDNGIWAGVDGSDYEFRVGTVSAGALVKGMHWDGSNLVWKATNTSLDASGNLSASNATLSGQITATTGAIGGWTINATSLTGGNATLANTGKLTLGTANDVLIADAADATYRLYIGNATAASAPFRVTKAGAVTATSGAIGGWTLGATSLTSGSAGTTVGIDSGGSNPAFYAGSATPGSAPFRVTNAGAVTATSGTVGGWTLAASSLTGGNATLSNTGKLTLGTSNDVLIADAADATYRLYIGNATAASAPFSVTKAGALKATTGTIAGDFTVSSPGKLLAGGSVLDSSGVAIGLYPNIDGGATPPDDAKAIAWYDTASTRTGLQARQYVGKATDGTPHWNVTVNPGGTAPLTMSLWYGGAALNALWFSNLAQVNGLPGLLLATGSPNTVQILSGARLQLNSGSAFVATAHLQAGAANTYDIGESGVKWRKLYVQDVVADTISGTSMSGTTWRNDASDMYIYSSAAGVRTLYIANDGAGVMGLNVEGDIALGGLVDGVDLAAFKSAYDIHNHDSRYYTETELATSGSASVHWSNLTNKPSTFAPSAHVLATTSGLGAEHTVSGLTAGYVLRASSATTAAFAQLAHSDLSGVGVNSHTQIDTHIATSDTHIAHSGVTLTAGDGLTGGGTIAASRTFTLGTPSSLTSTSTNAVTTTSHTHAIDATIARAAITLTAGNGLTGGGDLTANRTFAVGAGAGITVNADDVALASTTAGAGLTFTTGVLAVGAGAGITVNADDVALASTTAGAGLTFTTGVLAVGAGYGITVNADDVALASTVAGAGLTFTTGVLAVGAGYGITINADDVALASTVAGNGLSYTNGVLTVGVANTFTTGAAAGLSVEATAIRFTGSSNPGANAAPLVSNASGYLQLVRLGIGIAPTSPLHVSGSGKLTGSLDVDVQFLGQPSDSATAPSFSWTADTNTGFFQPAADTVAFATGGTERLRINSGGNVGFATTDIEAWSTSFRVLQLGTQGALMAQTNVGASSSMHIVQGAYYDGAWKYRNTASDEASSMVLADGYVQLRATSAGTDGGSVTWSYPIYANAAGVAINKGSAPSYALDVTGDIRATGTIYADGAIVDFGTDYLEEDGTYLQVKGTKPVYFNQTAQAASWSITTGGAATLVSIGASANLTLNPTGDIIIDPAGNDVLPNSNYDITLGSLSKKFLAVHAAELWVETLVAQETLATMGGRILVGQTSILTSDITAGATTIYLKHNNFRSGDIGYLEANGALEFIRFSSNASGTGPYTYTIVRNLDGTGAAAWYAGDAVFNTGAAGSGFIDMYSLWSIRGRNLTAIFNYSGSAYSSNYADSASWSVFGDGANNAINDAVYFGLSGTTWNNLHLNIVTAGVYTATLVWEYWNGSAWTTFTPDTTYDFKSTGSKSLTWTASNLTGWAATAINSVTAYWVRCRLSAYTSWTTLPVQGDRKVRVTDKQYGPSIVGNVRASNTWNDFSERWAIGNLDGLYDYGTDTYGAAFGKETATWLSMDDSNGLRIMNSATQLGRWDASGNITIGDAAGENLYITSAGVYIRNSTTSYTKLEAGVLTLGDSANEHVLINTSGMAVRDGSTIYASFGSTTTIGLTTSEHVNITSTSVQFKDGSSVYTDLTAGVITLGLTSTGEYMTLDSTNGVRIYNNATISGHWKANGDAVFGEATVDSRSRVEITSGALNFITRVSSVDTTHMSLSAAGVLTVGKVANSSSRVEINSGAVNIINRSAGGDDTTVISLDSSGSASFVGSVTANSGYIGGTEGWAISTGYLDSIASGAVNFRLSGLGASPYAAIGSPAPHGLWYGDGLWMGVEESSTNLVTNPSVETGTSGWTAYATGTPTGTRTRVSTQAYSGSYSYEIVKTGGATSDIYASYVSASVTTGLTYTFSVWIKVAAISGGSERVWIQASTNVTTTLKYVYGVSDWQRIVITTTATGTGSARLYIGAHNCDTATIYVDAVQVEQKAYVTPYFDGSLATASWSGTAHASTSTRAGATRARMGTVSTQSLTSGWAWDGSALTVKGIINATSGSFDGALSVGASGSITATNTVIDADGIKVNSSTALADNIGYRFYSGATLHGGLFALGGAATGSTAVRIYANATPSTSPVFSDRTSYFYIYNRSGGTYDSISYIVNQSAYGTVQIALASGNGTSQISFDAGTIQLNGASEISGAMTITNTLTVSGAYATTLGGTLTVTGVTTFNGNVTFAAAKTLTVGTGATSLGGTLTVTGVTTFNGNVTFAAAKTLTVGTGATSLGGTLGVTGATTLSNTLTVSGSYATSLGGTLGVTGLITATGGINNPSNQYQRAGTSGNIFVPLYVASLTDTGGGVWSSLSKTAATYSFDMQAAANGSVPTAAKAVVIYATGNWSTASTSNYIIVRARGSSQTGMVVRSQVANMTIDSQGIVELDATNHDIDIVVNVAGSFTARLIGYFI